MVLSEPFFAVWPPSYNMFQRGYILLSINVTVIYVPVFSCKHVLNFSELSYLPIYPIYHLY